MPPGDLITVDGQAEIRGLLIGRGTRYPVEDWSGLGLPEIRAADQALEADDGSAGGFDTYGPRSISARIGVSSGSRAELGVLRTALRRAFARTSTPAETVPFAVRLTGDVRIFDVRPRRLTLPWGADESARLITPDGAFEVVALDPYGYSIGTTDTDLTIADSASASPPVEIDNAGDARSRPVVAIGGPATDPMVTNATTGQALRLEVVLDPGDVLEVDVAAMTMTLNDVAGWWGAPDNDWLDLVAGAQDLVYSRTGGGVAATATVSWRHAYGGI